MKPQKIKFYKHGCKYGNKLITSLRVGQSYLNAHSFKIGLCQTPECDCGARQETSSHILLDCEFYVSDRQILFDFVGTQLSCFPKLGKKEKTDILLYGYKPDNNDFYLINSRITIAVHNFLMKTRRLEK